MKTASVKGPSVISVDETEKPVLNPGDILVQMQACGICGSDLEKVFGARSCAPRDGRCGGCADGPVQDG